MTATKTKRGLSLLLALLLLAGTVSPSVLAAEPEATPTPEIQTTASPEPSATPEAAEEPTAAPTTEPTEEPKEENNADPTATPTAEPSEDPEKTAEPTETPEASQQPIESAEPTETPEPSEEPEATETPVPSEEPEATESPEPSEEPVTQGTWENGEKGGGTWAYDPEQFVLTITGHGEMPDYSAEVPAPWNEISGDIKKILVKNEPEAMITAIGKFAFAGCKELTTVELPKEIVSVGEKAFYGCDQLTAVKFAGDAAAWEAIAIAPQGNDMFFVPGKLSVTVLEGEVQPVTALSLEETELVFSTMEESKTLTATVEPADTVLTWEIGDQSVATVENGTVTAAAPGETVVTVKAGRFSVSCPVLVEGIVLSANELTLTEGDTATLTATVYSSGEETPEITWETSDETAVSLRGDEPEQPSQAQGDAGIMEGPGIDDAAPAEPETVTGEEAEITALAAAEEKIAVTAKAGEMAAVCLVSVANVPRSVEAAPDITEFTFTAPTINTFLNTATLKPEKQDSGNYTLPIPFTAVYYPGKTLTIQAPEGYNGEFSVDYDKWTSTNEDEIKPVHTNSENGKIVLTDHYYQGNNTSSTVYGTENIKLQVNDTTYTLELKPYLEIQSLTFKIDRVSIKYYEEVNLVDEFTYSCSTLVAGTKYKLSCNFDKNILGNISNDFALDYNSLNIDNTKLVISPSKVNYTPSEGDEGTEIKVVITKGKYGYFPTKGNLLSKVEERTYTLKCTMAEEDLTPVIKNYTSATAKYVEQGDHVTFTVETEKTDSNTKYEWIDVASGEIVSEMQTVTAVTSRLQTQNYYCKVTNTKDGKTFTAQTAQISVNIRPKDGKLSPPVVTLDPQDASYSRLQNPEDLTADIQRESALFYYTQQWYINAEDDTASGTALEEPRQAQITDKLHKYPIYYVPDTGTEGEDWYYTVITASYTCAVEEGKIETYTSSVVTKAAKVTVTPLEMTLEGKGTEESPFLISNYNELKMVEEMVNGGTSFAGTYFQMTENITTEADWVPMGVTKDGSDKVVGGNNLNPFRGIFDGGSNTITIVKNGKPLFGYVHGATIRNLNIYGEYIDGYGLIDNWHGVNMTGITTISGVTILSGTSILKSGLVGGELNSENGYAAAANGFDVNISNCHVDSNVVIGCKGDQKEIGSIAGAVNGTISNCTSAVTVKGTSFVGGILGSRDNALGNCTVTGCTFTGSVSGTKNVGGIVGGGYRNLTAPNGGKVNIQNCSSSGSVSGTTNVGGILGGEEYVADAWSTHSITGNRFTGKVSGTTNVGGIIGFYKSLNVTDNIAGNYYDPACGASSGLGGVQFVDTSCPTHETASGATYLNSAVDELEYGALGVGGCWWKPDHNRNDDPLGADIGNLFTNEDKVVPTELTISGTYKTEYTKGEALDLSGAVFTVAYSNGDTKEVTLDLLTITGFDPEKIGDQTVTIAYTEGTTVRANIDVRVTPKSNKIHVTVSILGDSAHGENGQVHTMSGGGLQTWVSAAQYEADTAETVLDVLQRVFAANGITARVTNKLGGHAYIEALTWNGITLEEFSNGANSGWMYIYNGHHSLNAVDQQYLDDDAKIIVHYTDDYNLEEGSMGYDDADEAVKKVIGLIDAIGENVTLDSKAKVEAARKAYDALTYAQKQQVTNYAKLTAAEAKLKELQAEADKQAAKEVSDQIEALPSPATENDREAVAEARKAYDALTDAQKALVKNYQKLVDAERDIALLDATDEDIAAAEAVQKLIEDLPEPVTLDDKEAVEEARKAYDALTDLQKQLVTNLAKLEEAEARLALWEDLSEGLDIYTVTGEFIEALDLDDATELYALGMARSGHEVSEDFYDDLVAYVNDYINEDGQLHRSRSEENARMILVLTALGYDVTDVGGHDLLMGLSDMEYLKKQGVTGPAWALIALDSHDYEVPNNPNAADQTSREKLLDYLMEERKEDGGWALTGKLSDAETTAIVLTALAPYYPEDEDEELRTDEKEIKAAVDAAVQVLSGLQDADGGYSAMTADGADTKPDSKTTAQVLTAISALEINGHTDERFVKNGKSLVDALCEYYVEGGGFSAQKDGDRDDEATEQCYNALTAYLRMLNEENSLYDMSDVEIRVTAPAPTVAPEEPEPTEAPAAPKAPEVPEVPETQENEEDDGGFWGWLTGLFK